mmetsp:Transcript_118172/g.329567  ORF Transcript_118172/g.329567 Transcript_118172/m.329567 type:complete len:211 (+) Transcript_118172:301-933(+)
MYETGRACRWRSSGVGRRNAHSTRRGVRGSRRSELCMFRCRRRSHGCGRSCSRSRRSEAACASGSPLARRAAASVHSASPRCVHAASRRLLASGPARPASWLRSEPSKRRRCCARRHSTGDALQICAGPVLRRLWASVRPLRTPHAGASGCGRSATRQAISCVHGSARVRGCSSSALTHGRKRWSSRPSCGRHRRCRSQADARRVWLLHR